MNPLQRWLYFVLGEHADHLPVIHSVEGQHQDFDKQSLHSVSKLESQHHGHLYILQLSAKAAASSRLSSTPRTCTLLPILVDWSGSKRIRRVFQRRPLFVEDNIDESRACLSSSH